MEVIVLLMEVIGTLLMEASWFHTDIVIIENFGRESVLR